MATPRLAKSLEVLRDECNAYAPNRSKAMDGWIGDSAHAARPSRHNPNNFGVVCALDITHDPAGGMDVHALARRLVKHPHPDLTYVISNRQVARRSNGWVWQTYTGSSPHDKHAHFAVGLGPDSEPTPPYDDVTPWGVAPEMEEDMNDVQAKQLEELRTVIAPKQSYVSAITNALLIGDKAGAKKLNDEFWQKWPSGVSGLPRGWSGA